MKKSLVRMLVLVIAIVMVSSCFMGCFVKKPQITEGELYDVNIDLDKNISATLKIMSYENERKLFEEFMIEFNKTYPNVKLEFDVLSGGLYSTLLGYYSGNTMPDILINQCFDMLALDDAKMLLNLNPYINAEKASTAEGAFKQEDYFEYFWKLGQKDFDGAQIMMPRLSDQVVVAYNKDILTAAGVDLTSANSVVKNGWTWDNFLDVCSKVKAYYTAQSNVLPIMDSYITWEAVFNAILESYGVEYFKDGQATIDSPEMRAALESIRGLREAGYIGKTTSSAAKFDNGQGAFLVHSRSVGDTVTALKKNASEYANLSNEQISQKIGFVSFPLIMANNAPKIGCGVAGYSVASTSTNRDVAWQFLKLILSKNGQNIFAKNGISGPPMRKDMMDKADTTNAWSANYTNFNLEAYTYGREQNYISATTFMAQRPAKANDIVGTVGDLISNYINYDGSSKESKLNSLLTASVADLNYWVNQA